MVVYTTNTREPCIYLVEFDLHPWHARHYFLLAMSAHVLVFIFVSIFDVIILPILLGQSVLDDCQSFSILCGDEIEKGY